MNVFTLIERLKANGIELRIDDGVNIIVTPADRLTDVDRYWIRTLKRDLLKPLPAEILGVLNAWLDSIEESDPELRRDYIYRCAADSEQLRHAIRLADALASGG